MYNNYVFILYTYHFSQHMRVHTTFKIFLFPVHLLQPSIFYAHVISVVMVTKARITGLVRTEATHMIFLNRIFVVFSSVVLLSVFLSIASWKMCSYLGSYSTGTSMSESSGHPVDYPSSGVEEESSDSQHSDKQYVVLL